MQTWVVPATGSYIIAAAGAEGNHSSFGGGDGAYVSGTFALTSGEVIHIVVGQMGGTENGHTSSSGGGGGGGFVYKSDLTLLLAAGGGGGHLGYSGGSYNCSNSAGTYNSNGQPPCWWLMVVWR